MRLFMATLSTETNTFCTMPTGLSGFKEYFLRYGTATQDPPNLMTEALHVWRNRAEALGWDIVESLAAIAEPAGPTVQACYEMLRGQIIADLERVDGADVILLQLHGAMVAEEEPDCEGDIVTRIRAMCPNAVIGLALDQHCHLTDRMVSACDLIVAFKEYPHDDATARAEDLFRLAHRTLNGEIDPVMAVFDCRMIHLYLTKEGAMRAFVDRLSDLEGRNGILSVSLGHGFPWADLPEVGARMLVVADGDQALAQHTATRLGRDFFDLRDQVTGVFPDITEALDQIASDEPGPVVLADMGDNSGGGAPGDATFFLRDVLRRGLTRVASGLYWDPMVVQQCEDAGEGAHLRLRLGGKTSEMSGDPLDINARVMKIVSGQGQHLGAGLEPLGTCVWLRLDGEVDIIANNLRVQVYSPEPFEHLGIDLAAKQIVIVKSLFHFYGPFAKIAARIVQVGSPGGTSPNFRDIPYTQRDPNYWPLVENPFEGE